MLSVGAASDQVLHCLLTDCIIFFVIKMKNTKEQQHTIFYLRSGTRLLHVRRYNGCTKYEIFQGTRRGEAPSSQRRLVDAESTPLQLCAPTGLSLELGNRMINTS